MTIAALNGKIAHLNLVCTKHFDYFWFGHGDGDDLSTVVPQSVMLRRFGDLSMDSWQRHVVDAQR